MPNQRELFDLIRQLTGQLNILAIPKLFLEYTGGLEAALLLSQILYWSDKGSGDDGWFYKTDAEWGDELGLSRYATRKARKRLEAMGILETKVRRAMGSPTVHYHLKWMQFLQSIVRFQTNQTLKTDKPNSENGQTITETTTENTPKISTTTTIEPPDENLGKAARLYEENKFGLITPLAKGLLIEMVDTYPILWIEEAMKEAVASNVRRLRYVERILERWAVEGKDDGRGTKDREVSGDRGDSSRYPGQDQGAAPDKYAAIRR